jgi:tetratricopeptide (TPR) repeat protein
MKITNRGVASIVLAFGLSTILFVSVAPQAVAQKEDHAVPILSPQELFKRLSPSVFVVEVLDGNGSLVATGSAVAVASDQVVTNKHVIEAGVAFRIKQGSRTWSAAVTYVDPEHDLGRLTAVGLKAPAVPVRPSSVLTVGEHVYSIGAPEGLELTVSEGLISGLREFEQVRLIQTSAAISHGSSGGGLFDGQGNLIGITTFFLKEGQNLNFALPGEWVRGVTSHRVSMVEKNKIKTPDSQVLSWFQLGLQMRETAEYEKAVRAFSEVVRLAPGESAGWNNLGSVYAALNQYDKALPTFQEAVRLNPDNVEARDNLGVAYAHLQQYEKAISAALEAVRLKPDDAVAWSTLGVVYYELHEYEKAISADQEAVRLQPDRADTWYNLGGIYADLHQYEKAIFADQQGIRLKPDDASAWYFLGRAYAALQQFDKALSAYQEAIRLEPGNVGAWYSLGFLYRARGDRSNVMLVYQKLRTLDQDRAEKFFGRVVLP